MLGGGKRFQILPLIQWVAKSGLLSLKVSQGFLGS